MTGTPGHCWNTTPAGSPWVEGDIDARDRKVAAWLHQTAQALAEIGEIDLATDWAKQAADFDGGHQSLAAAGYWCELLAQHEPKPNSRPDRRCSAAGRPPRRPNSRAGQRVRRGWTTATRYATRWPVHRGMR